MSQKSATLIGFIAIVLWSLLALFTAASGEIPPLQLSAITFALGGFLGMIRWLQKPSRIRILKQPIKIWFLGIFGLFGYHFAYFTALKNAPPVEASLIAFLWPLLIVLFSAFLPGEKLRLHHIGGAILGFLGAALIVTKGDIVSFETQYIYGYSMALLCAFIWSSYSVISRRFAETPTDIVTGFCLATSVLSLIAHLLLETTVWPSTNLQWIAILCLGMGPVGLAFYAWDYGVKKGDIQVLGASSYLAPLLSTLILIIAGFAELSIVIVVACLLITVGAIIAAKDLIFSNNSL